MNFWQELLQGVSDHPSFFINLAVTVLVVLMVYGIRGIFVRLISRRVEDMGSLYLWQKNSGYVAVLLALLILVPLWIGGITDILTYLGLISAGLAIALQGLILDFVAWLFILMRRPFRVGDRIQLGEFAGDVIDLRVFQFSLVEIGNWVDADQSTGRVINVPNRKVFNEVLANFHGGFEFIWNEIPVLLTFESNWKKAKRILTNIAEDYGNQLSESAQIEVKKASQKYMIFYKNLTPRVYTTVKDSGVLLTIRYICNPRRRRGTMEEMWEEILTQFAACDDIDFAYPTIRTYDNRGEGKPQARA
jgi:small-conductance mechanosensitive channel